MPDLGASPPPPVAQAAAPALPPAAVWARAAALVVDVVVLRLAGLAVGLPVAFVAWIAPPLAGLVAVLFYAFAVAVPFFYFAALESGPHQATLGKRLLGLAVTDGAGGRLEPGRALGRAVARIASALPLGLGFVPAAFGDRRALHDRLVDTRVVQRRPVDGLGVVVAVVALGYLAVKVLLRAVR